MRKIYRIDMFKGLDLSQDENALESGYSADACNMDTRDGSLTVAGGYERYSKEPIPGGAPIGRLIVFRHGEGERMVATDSEAVYAYVNGQWEQIHVFPAPLKNNRIDTIEARVGDTDCLLLACGEHPVIQYDGGAASVFGTEDGDSLHPVNYLAMYSGRLFAAGNPASPDRLYWSALPGDGRNITHWGAVEASPAVEGGHTQVGSVGGDPITGLKALPNQLVIFKRHSIYRLIGDRPANFVIEPVEALSGSQSHTSTVASGGAAYFINSAGLHMFNGVAVQQAPQAHRIRRLIEQADIRDARAALSGETLYILLKQGEQPVMLQYDLQRRTFMQHKGFDATDLCANGDDLYMINQTRLIYRFGPFPTYDGEPIEAHWRTPLTDLYDKGGIKCLRELYLRGETDDKESALLIEASVGGHAATYRALLPNNPSEVLEIPLQNEGRTFSLKFYNEAGGHFSLRGGVELALGVRRRVE